MTQILKIFKYIAYLQLVFLFGGIYVLYEPLLDGSMFGPNGKEIFIQALSNSLILLGFSFSLVSLRDQSKMDKMGRWIIERPKFFKVSVLIWILMGLVALGFGIFFLIVDIEKDRLGIGLCSFGLGFLSLVKSIMDQAKTLTNHY